MAQTPTISSPLDAYRLWVGVGFALLLVTFLIVAFFRSPRMTDGQREILRVLSSLCAGFSGFLIAGEALFRMDARLGSGGTLAVSGTAGFALFFAVWYGFSRTFKAPDAFSISIPDGWTFEQTARAIATNDKAVAEFEGFTPAQLAQPLASQTVRTDTPEDAMRALRLLAKSGAIPEYQVTLQRPRYILRASP